MFRTDQAFFLLTILLRRLLGWLCGNLDIAHRELFWKRVPVGAGSPSFGVGRQNCQGQPDYHGRQSCQDLADQDLADIGWITTRLDPIPLGCDASGQAPWCGGSMPVARPAPPGRA